MKRRLAILLSMVLLFVVVLGYVSHRQQFGNGGPTTVLAPSGNEQRPLRDSSPQDSQSLSIPPPPPRPSGTQTIQSQPDPQRTLIEDGQLLRRIERHLPEKGTVAIYPISNTENAAALATDDIINDGVIETAVAYRTSKTKDQLPSSSLKLAIFTTRNNELVLAAITPLYGTYIQNNILEKHTVPFAIRNVTGGERKQILVTSSIGASLGSVLEVFSFENSSLRKIAEIAGDIIEVADGQVHNPALITVKSMRNKQTKSYRWNGQKFEESG